MSVEKDKILMESLAMETKEKKEKPLKFARSAAELHAIKQRNIQICLVATNVLLSALIALKTFGII